MALVLRHRFNAYPDPDLYRPEGWGTNDYLIQHSYVREYCRFRVLPVGSYVGGSDNGFWERWNGCGLHLRDCGNTTVSVGELWTFTIRIESDTPTILAFISTMSED